MKTLFLHIGTHKTGSTAIQKSLAKNCAMLRDKGLVCLPYPNPPVLTPLMFSETISEELVDRFRIYIETHKVADANVSQDLNYLLSWEGLCGNPLTGYSNAPVVAEHVRRATVGIKVRILVYLRRQDEFVESLYTQKIHEGEAYTFETFVSSLRPFSFNWENLLTAYATRFDKCNVTARRYDAAFLPKKESLLRDFYGTLGFDFSEFPSEQQLPTPNRGYSRPALEVARLCNPFLNSDEKRKLRRILQQTSSKQPFEQYSFWPRQQRESFLNQLSESNARIAREYLSDSSGVLFPLARRNGAESWNQELTLEQIVPILIKLLLREDRPERTPFALRVADKAERKISKTLSRHPLAFSMTKALRRKLGV